MHWASIHASDCGNVHIVNDNKSIYEALARHVIISNGLLSPLLVVILLPLYLCLIRPRISYHIPGMFKRMGLGIILTIVSLAALDVVVHARYTSNARCMLNGLLTVIPLSMLLHFHYFKMFTSLLHSIL